MKGRYSAYIRIVISMGLLALLFYIMRGKYTLIITALRSTNLLLFCAACLTFIANIIINTLRLRTLLSGEQIDVPFLKLIELTCIGFFFNNFMPSAIGGDIVKAYYAGKITHSKGKSYLSVFMDRLTGMFSFAIVGLFAVIVSWNAVTDPVVKKSVLTFVLICGIAAVTFLNAGMSHFITSVLSKVHFRNIGKKILQVYNMLHNYRKKKGVLLKAIMISWVSQLAYFSVVYILFLSVNVPMSFKVVLLIMPLVSVIALLPSLGGLGLREGAILVFFGPIAGSEKAFGVSILLFAILLLISIVGGIIYSVSPQFRTDKIAKEGMIYDR